MVDDIPERRLPLDTDKYRAAIDAEIARVRPPQAPQTRGVPPTYPRGLPPQPRIKVYPISRKPGGNYETDNKE